MKNVRMQWISPLEKILPGQSLPPSGDLNITALRGEKTAVQLAVDWSWQMDQPFRCDCQLKLDKKQPVDIDLYQVKDVPSAYPAYPLYDHDYLSTTPGLYPDRLAYLMPAADARQPAWPLNLVAERITVIWLELTIPDHFKADTISFKLQLVDDQGTLAADAPLKIDIIPVSLPEQQLRHTEWFHTDCLADYYQADVFSERHWQIIESFIRMAADHSVNMLLTPLFTPPLDTAVGGERTTVQLIDVSQKKDEWNFGFDKLKRWVDLAQSCGIRYFEMAHLFTQWGAKAAPKVMAETEAGCQQVFGWDTPAVSPGYRAFLNAFLPKLTDKLKEWGLADRCYFHVSDEPQLKDLESYRQARDMIRPLLKGFPIIDALSDFDFYQKGVVEKPIPANNHIKPFLEAGVPGLWTYYCCGQYMDVSNRFMAMPSARNRILGVQLYLYQIEGFLHWGYNFYNSQYSLRRINPYAETDAGCAFPSGDAFLVYPGENGQPEASLRLKVLNMAMQDMRALYLLESLTSREHVLSVISDGLSEDIRFDRYPRDASWLLDLRNRVNQDIRTHI